MLYETDQFNQTTITSGLGQVDLRSVSCLSYEAVYRENLICTYVK